MDRSRGASPGPDTSRPWTRPADSQRRSVSARFPGDWVRAMFRRASQWGRDQGGRFETRTDMILLWSAEQPPREAQVVGWLSVRWDSPAAGQATIHEVGWIPSRGGTPHEMCRAIQLLSGLWMPGVGIDT